MHRPTDQRRESDLSLSKQLPHVSGKERGQALVNHGSLRKEFHIPLPYCIFDICIFAYLHLRSKNRAREYKFCETSRGETQTNRHKLNRSKTCYCDRNVYTVSFTKPKLNMYKLNANSKPKLQLKAKTSTQSQKSNANQTKTKTQTQH